MADNKVAEALIAIRSVHQAKGKAGVTALRRGAAKHDAVKRQQGTQNIRSDKLLKKYVKEAHVEAMAEEQGKERRRRNRNRPGALP